MIPKTLVILLVAAAVVDLTLGQQRPGTRSRVVPAIPRGRSRTLTTTTTAASTTTTTPLPSTQAEEEFEEVIEEEIVLEDEPIVISVPSVTAPSLRRTTIPRVTAAAATTAARRPTTNARTTATQQRVTPAPTTTRARPVATSNVDSLEEEDIKSGNVVGTIRRYNTLNVDGSFTFGYENEDGSFKEETRGVDCVVRGKYGYVDPDGVRREFTYVSGNPCDPNRNNNEEEENQEDNRPLNIPARRPVNANTPARRPVPAQASSFEENDATILQQFNVNPAPQRTNPPTRKVVTKTRVQNTNTGIHTQQQQQQHQHQQEEVFFGSATPSPNRLNTPPRAAVAQTTPATPSQGFNFDDEVARFGSNNQNSQQRPVSRPVSRPVFVDDDDSENERPSRPRTGTRTFTSELTFDRKTNQFQSNLLQRIPDQDDISIRETLVGFVPSSSTTTTTTASPPVAITTQRPVPQVSATASTVARVRPTTPRTTISEPEINFNSFGPPAQQVQDQLQRQREQQQQQNFLRQQQQSQTFFNNQPQQQQQQPAFPSQQFAQNNPFPVQDHRFAQQQQQLPNFGNNPFAPQQAQAFNNPSAFGPSSSQQQANFFANQQFPQQQPQRFAPNSLPALAPVRAESTPVRPSQPRPVVDANAFATGQIDAFLSG